MKPLTKAIVDELYADQAEFVFAPELSEGDMLAHLIIAEKVFVNCPHWCAECKAKTCEHNEEHVVVLVSCNDVFAWGMGDVEDIHHDEIRDLWAHYIADIEWGVDVWCVKRRKMRPQAPVLRELIKAGYDVEAWGLAPSIDERITERRS